MPSGIAGPRPVVITGILKGRWVAVKTMVDIEMERARRLGPTIFLKVCQRRQSRTDLWSTGGAGPVPADDLQNQKNDPNGQNEAASDQVGRRSIPITSRQNEKAEDDKGDGGQFVDQQGL
jgi:hypothetical protein